MKKLPKLLNIAKNEGAKKAFYFCAVLAALILLWWVAAAVFFKNNPAVPAPPEVFGGVWAAAKSGKLWLAAWNTVFKAFLGFVFSFILGLILAVLANLFARVKYCLEPVVTIARSFPTLGVTYLLLMYFGVGETAVIIGVLVIFPIFYASLFAAIRDTDPKVLQMADAYRIGRSRRTLKILLPGILPQIFAAVLSAFALNIKVVIAAEIVGGIAPNTIGNFMSIARSEGDYAAMFTWVLVAVMLAFLAEAAIKLVMRLSMPWAGNQITNYKLQITNKDDTSASDLTSLPIHYSLFTIHSPTPHSSLLTPNSPPSAIPPKIEFRSVSFSFPATRVFQDFSAEFSPGKIHCIFGPSGSGKTTLLNVTAGLIKPQSGGVLHDGKSGTPRVSYMFQEPRLIGERTVLKNLTLVLEPVLAAEGKTRKEARAEAKARALAMLGAVGLKDAANRYPGALSGGMAQRVSLARAFCFPSQILLMDEPFKGLDYRLQKSARALFLSLWAQNPKTVLLVTHDADEAVLLSDEIHRFCRYAPVTGFSELSIPAPREGRKASDPELAALKERLLCD